MSYSPTPGSKTEKLLHALRARQTAMRSDELADVTGIAAGNIQGLLDLAVKHGLVSSCKVTVPGKIRPTNEYRIGPGLESRTSAPEYKPAKPTIIPVRSGDTRVIIAQPEVAINNTGSDPQAATSQPAAVAVAAPAVSVATPEPEAKGRGMGPAARKAPAGTVDLGFSIDDGGALTIWLNDGMSDPFVLEPAETLALGDFMWATKKIWRP